MLTNFDKIINPALTKIIVFKSKNEKDYYYYINPSLNLTIRLTAEPQVFPKFGYNEEYNLSFKSTHRELIDKVSDLDNSIVYVYYIDFESNIGYKLSHLKNTKMDFSLLEINSNAPLEMEVSSVVDLSGCYRLDDDEMFLMRVIANEKST